MKARYYYAFAALILVAACSDDESGKPSTNAEPNSVDIDSGTTDSGGPSDSGIQDGGGEDDTGGTDAGTDTGGETDMGTDMAMEVDMGEPYEWPATAGDFITTADRVSYIATLTIPEVNDNQPVCCRDFGAISENPGEIDNAFALLDSQLSGIPGSGIDFQRALDDALVGGQLVLLLDHRELDGADDPDGFLLSWLDGAFAAGTTFAEASAGTGTFDVRASSFIGNTGEPAQVMNPADMTASVMSGGPISVEVILPFGAASILVPIRDTRASATATIATDSVTYQNGDLSGYILLDEIYDGLNTLANSATCACLGLNGADLFTRGANGSYSGMCINDVDTLCPNPGEFACTVIAGSNFQTGQVCTLLPGILANSADIDTDGDDQADDALSIGLNWTAVDASLQ